MKKTILIVSAIAAITFAACNSNNSTKDNNMGMNHDSMPMPMKDNTGMDNNVKMVTTTFSSVDPAVASYIKTLVTDYLGVKNALVNSNETEAATASGNMYAAMKSFDKSLLTADQKKVYDDIESDLKEHAEHISKSKIDHQREHFATMSKDMYDMVKAFGAGMTLYHDHCPMYSDGSMWLSETKEIKNPFYGDKMMTCGSVEEMMK
ncbi:MAG TPA: DUF3347 domain-containing protein [Chitinophagaceae bacterium]|nr:DUF3347 domain-containing protein [Bacteroidota bacterium]MCB0774886.1 DUF3347 domain-containing protein [Chitinophagaceae bacterium]MCB9054371.1 DUF3347 domain-containing protein [Chitinophagales bacterium]HPG10771.1 DUF3347 domain-containing protein [Chitinophagaceae bacterium]HRX94540.1 DUF3347 domain-containing protein [Chitinophagaceae bacterium]